METEYIANENTLENVERKKKCFFERAKEHKKEIAIGAVVVFAVAMTVFVFRKKIAIRSLDIIENLNMGLEAQSSAVTLDLGLVQESATSNLSSNNIANVKMHIRNLPNGWRPSPSKIELAAKYGYSLREHQTLVNAYTKAVA